VAKRATQLSLLSQAASDARGDVSTRAVYKNTQRGDEGWEMPRMGARGNTNCDIICDNRIGASAVIAVLQPGTLQ
jgi:hypothetical protein